MKKTARNTLGHPGPCELRQPEADGARNAKLAHP